MWMTWGMTTISFRHQLRAQESDFAVALEECVPRAFFSVEGVGDTLDPGPMDSRETIPLLLQRGRAGYLGYIFADPCGLESVLCEGEDGWEE
jgi:hypothetical protein